MINACAIAKSLEAKNGYKNFVKSVERIDEAIFKLSQTYLREKTYWEKIHDFAGKKTEEEYLEEEEMLRKAYRKMKDKELGNN